MKQASTQHQRLVYVLSAAFVLAVLMGTGPGIYLVNPDPADPQAVRTFLGIPIIYAWCASWYLVQAAVILTAYLWVWDRKDLAIPATSAGQLPGKEEVNS